MLLWGETLGLKEKDYVPILMCTIDNDIKKRKQNNNINNKPKKYVNKEMKKLEKECGLLW